MAVSPFFMGEAVGGQIGGQNWIYIGPEPLAVRTRMSSGGRNMAWLEKKGQRFLLVFRLNGSRYKKLLDLTDRREADAITAKVERRIEMLERGEWQLPDPSNVADSLIGELAPRPVVALPQGKTLGAMIDEYIPSVSTGCLESNSVATLTVAWLLV